MTRGRLFAVAGGAAALVVATAVAAVAITTSEEPAPTPTNVPTPPLAAPATPTPPADPSIHDAAVTLTQVASAQAPIAAATAPDGTLWIAERAGLVRPLTSTGLSDPVLDISSETTTGSERGLLGIAFHPEFTHFYISFTNRSGNTSIDEFALAGAELQVDTRRTVFTHDQPFANHNGGHIAFGPDGMLYIGLGDGGSAGDPLDAGQDLNSLLGALLRIDPTGGSPYAIPPDNPFLDDPAAQDEIWAYGLRNPWRFSFDAQTGDLFIADVGQSAWEEINWTVAGSGGGENYGWARMEGTGAFRGAEEPADHVPPVFEYETTQERCSVTGGYVYRGEAIPELVGAYLFSDYCEGAIRALELRDGQVAGEVDLGLSAGEVVSFGQGPDRELYVLDLAGAVYRIDPAG